MSAYIDVYTMCDVYVSMPIMLQLRSVHFVWAVRNWKDILYFEDVLQMLQQHQALVANGNTNGNVNGRKPTLALSASIYLTGGDKSGTNDWLGELPQCITANLKQVCVCVFDNVMICLRCTFSMLFEIISSVKVVAQALCRAIQGGAVMCTCSILYAITDYS
jgi:hypothetical protein